MEENLSPLFHALADPNRLRIIDLLRHEDLTVGAIAERLDISQPQTSKQLRVLYDAGLVSVTIEANRRRYALNRQALKPLDVWRSRLEAETARLDRLEEFLNQSKREGTS
ncbi:metalloregulator ArsR/SmtB family transcription factor [Exiguobacterium sp. s146]|uniref:ArsR/SmtB family transcription factor n=1 Tax=Exiguobacterium sp. s146 TaxID=2751223 RepID=UPI001BE90D53|nr:metalloregulator ArsR/SmtB family transcription factor [Exiguobacterium sp. s146]